MGSLLYDFLTESFLFRPALIESSFEGIRDAEITAELQRYREFCLNNLEKLQLEAGAPRSTLCVFAGQWVNLQTLKQSALYIERYVLPDPLFALTPKRTQSSEAMRAYFQLPQTALDREALLRAVKYLKSLTPMVAADYVKLLPVSYLFEPPAQPPVYYSRNEFADILPPELASFLRERIRVNNLRKADDKWVVEDGLTPGRAIALQFTDDDSSRVFVQHLFEQKVLSFDDATRIVKFEQYLPESPPAKEYFDVWVRQSVNRAAITFYDDLRKEIALAAALDASYLRRSQLVSDLLTRFFPDPSGAAMHTANIVLSVDLPFLDNIDTDKLMNVRRNDGEVFQNFRNELDKRLWDLRFETDPQLLRSKAEGVFHDLGVVQTSALSVKAKDLKRGALAQATVVIATLAGSLVAAGLTPIAPVVAAAGAIKALADYRLGVRANPAFFLWKVRADR